MLGVGLSGMFAHRAVRDINRSSNLMETISFCPRTRKNEVLPSVYARIYREVSWQS